MYRLQYLRLTGAFAILTMLAATSPLGSSSAHAISLPGGGVPFGGQIVQYFPGCLVPSGAAVTINQPIPTGGSFPVPLMYLPGTSISFPYGPPKRPGQWLLGSAGPFVPCMVMCGGGWFFSPYPCPYTPQPGGMLILFHGSSQ